MKLIARLALYVCLLAAPCVVAAPNPAALNPAEELQRVEGEVGRYGGHLVIGQRSEPKTLNPVTATDAVSREVIGRLMADLITINRASQQSEPGLAKSWTTSADGRTFTLKLRKGIRFSDGHPFDADDVIFSFTVYLDVLPKHILEKPYREGRFVQSWSLNTPPAEVVGLGPFRVKEYLAGQRIVLERNPYYWKADHDNHRLPYLDELVFLFVGSEDAQVMRFEAGETDMVSRLSSENFALLTKERTRTGSQLVDLGPSLEYNFLVFNLNDLATKKLNIISGKQTWFRDLKFRQAVSAAIDRDSIVRLVYGARGTALWGNVGPGNKLWVNQAIPHPQRSLDASRQLLKSAGFSWNNASQLLDPSGKAVEFSIITSSSNTQRMKMATLVQDDLAHLGMQVHVVPLDFRAMLDRVFQSFAYEAAIMGLGGGDPDPNPEMNVWLSSGSTHLWHLGETQPASDWEREIDQLMQQQMITLNYEKRKRLYNRVQQLIAENLPFVFLATPNVLAGAKAQVGNFHPAVLDHYTLWNADQLYLRTETRGMERAGIR